MPTPIIERKKVGFPVPLENISFGSVSSIHPMDQWLEFNLSELCGSKLTKLELYGDIL